MTITHRDSVIGLKATHNAFAAPSASEMMFLSSSITLSVSLHRGLRNRAQSSFLTAQHLGPGRTEPNPHHENYQQYHSPEE